MKDKKITKINHYHTNLIKEEKGHFEAETKLEREQFKKEHTRINFMELITMIRDNKEPEKIYIEIYNCRTAFIWTGEDYINEEYEEDYLMFQYMTLWEALNIAEIYYLKES